MILPQELRIGNYVFDIDGDVLQIGQILDIGVKFKNTSLSSRYEKIKPIPLTEEILLKFGFDIEWLLSDSKCYYVLINNKKIRIKFVHSLQNIYLCIEQKELNLCL